MCRAFSLAFVLSILALVPRANAADTNLPPELAERTDTIAAALEDLAPEGWEANGPVERYVVKNMYDKINGRSELFMSYGVTGMTFVTLSDKADDDRYIDIFLYDMTTAPGAFGVFSVERWPGNDLMTIGREGYRTGNDVFFWKGRYYACLVGSDDTIAETQNAVARKLEARLEDTGEQPWGLSVLPSDQQLPETVQYFQVDALSLAFLTDTYTAEYDWAEESVKVFVSRQASPEKAEAAHAEYVKYMREYGEALEKKDFKGFLVTSADMGGGYVDTIFYRGNYVAGVTAVPDRATAEQTAARLYQILGDK